MSIALATRGYVLPVEKPPEIPEIENITVNAPPAPPQGGEAEDT